MLRTKTRGELPEIIVLLVQVEQHFTATEIANRSGMTKLELSSREHLHGGKFGGEYYKKAAEPITGQRGQCGGCSFRIKVEHSENTN